MRSDLAQSYGRDRLPRYTSYPTAPHFSPTISEGNYRGWLKSVPVRQPASIYLHVPFCRSMCWYCGCHTSVTKRDDPVAIYAAGLRAEANLVAETIGQRLPISHVHFGGGTPTIMTPGTLVDLVGALQSAHAHRTDDGSARLLRRQPCEPRRPELRSGRAARHQPVAEL